MAKNLLSIGGLYINTHGQETNGKGEGAAWSISADRPDWLQIWVLIERSTVEISLRDISSIDTYDVKGKGKLSAVRVSLANGDIHILDLKKQAKAEDARDTLLKLRSDLGV